MEFDAAQARRTDAMDLATLQAWRTVQIFFKARGDKRMPKLSAMLQGGVSRRGPTQSVEAQRQALQVLSLQYGYPLRKAVQH